MTLKSNPTLVAPGAYQPEKSSLLLDRKPAFTFGLKTIVEKPNNTPAPGAYEPEKSKLDNTPSYSFGIRPNLDKPNTNPGKFWKSTSNTSACVSVDNWLTLFL